MAPTSLLLPSLSLLQLLLLCSAAAASPTATAVHLPLRPITPPPTAPAVDGSAPALDHAQKLAAMVSASLARARHLKNPKKAHPLRTPLLSHSYGGYSISLGFGTPPQRIPLLLDTGSDLVWVPCTASYQCSNCSFLPPAGVPLFSPKASSSAKLLGCRNPKCAWLHAPKLLDRCRDCPPTNATAGCSRVCPPYIVVYGSGSTGGLLLSETMDVPGGVDVVDFVVGCSIFSTHQPPAGVAGFGRGPASLPSQLGLRRFSYCLISRIYDDQEGAMGDVVLEGTPESSRDGLAFTPFLRNPAATPFSVYYYLGLRRITVDGAKVRRIPHAALLPLPSGDGGTIIDAGTTFTYMEPSVFEPVAGAVAAAAAGLYNRSEVLEQLTGLRPCFRLAGDRKYRLPQLTFHFKGGAEMRLPPANYFALVGEEEEAACLTLMTDAGGAGRRAQGAVHNTGQLPAAELLHGVRPGEGAAGSPAAVLLRGLGMISKAACSSSITAAQLGGETPLTGALLPESTMAAVEMISGDQMPEQLLLLSKLD